KAVTPDGKADIGNQGDIFPQPFAHDSRRRRKHFAHAGPALWTFVTNHNNLALSNRAIEDRTERSLFRFKNARRSAEMHSFFATDLGHGAGGREIAIKDNEMASAPDGIVEAAHDILARRISRSALQVFGKRLAGHRQAIAM